MKLTTPLKSFLLFSAIMVALLSANVVFAQATFANQQDCPTYLTALNGCEGGLRGIVLAIVNFFLGFLGLLAVIMVIYGGFLYVGSAGNDENVGKAKKILLYAAVGIIIILVSFALVNTILGAATSQ